MDNKQSIDLTKAEFIKNSRSIRRQVNSISIVYLFH
jgi:hypothetical protein